MGFLDKFKKQKSADQEPKQQQQSEQRSSSSSASPDKQGRRVKRYTSEGKPVYE